MSKRQLRLIVRGRVQGVGFRYFVRRVALEQHLDGEVKNRSDGAVEIVAAGAAEALSRLMDAVREGPQASRVQDVEVQWESGPKLRQGFHVTG